MSEAPQGEVAMSSAGMGFVLGSRTVRGGRANGATMGSVTARGEATDAEWSALMAAAQAGDKAAYGRLLRECTPLIRRVVRRGLTPDRVDDVVQDVLFTIHRARHAYDPARSFSAWVVTIAQRRAIDLMRNRGRHDHREVHNPLAYEAFADETVDRERDGLLEGDSGTLKAALADLPPRQREAVEVLALRQMSLDEAAEATGIKKGALKVSLHRALKSLRERFGVSE